MKKEREFLLASKVEGGKWICGFGRCTRPALYVLVTYIFKKRGKDQKRYSGGCETCANRYAKRNELVLPIVQDDE